MSLQSAPSAGVSKLPPDSVFDNENGNGDKRPKAIKVDPPPGAQEEKKKRGRPKGSVNQAKISLIEDTLNEFLTLPAMAFATVGDQQCAWLLAGENSPGRNWSHAMANLAKQSPSVRNVLLKLNEGGAWGGVIVASLMVALPIASHHGALPPRFDVVTQFIMSQMPDMDDGE